MSIITRFGFYYLNVNITIPVADKVMTYRQKIHSNHPGFFKIDPKYLVNYLVHESQIPMGERGQYVEFDPQGDSPKTAIPVMSIESPKETIVEAIVEELKQEEPVEKETNEIKDSDDIQETSIEIEPEKEKIESKTEETPKPKRQRKSKE